MKSIKFIAVGGTIDKVYFDSKSQYEVGPPDLALLLINLNLEMNDSDRELI